MSQNNSLKSYYQTISAMGKLAMAKKKAEGETMSLAPLGYRNVRINGRSTIEPDPETFKLVQKAHKLHGEGLSTRKICEILERDGLLTKRRKALSPMSVWRIVKRKDHPNAQ